MNISAIIHLSDIECGLDNRGNSDSLVDGYQKVTRHLIDDVRKLVINDWKMPQERIGLVISGDIAGKGLKEEYAKAKIVIDTLKNELGINSSRIAVVPGNHDIDWGSCKDKFLQKYSKNKTKDNNLRRQARSWREKLANYGEFTEYACEQEWGGPESVVSFPGFEDLGLAVVGLDTTYKCTFCDEDNIGFLRDDPVSEAGQIVAKQLTDNPSLHPLVILHHCPLPRKDVNPKDTSYFENGEESLNRLQDVGLRTILCGHEHETRVSRDERNYRSVFATGSFGLTLNGLTKRYHKTSHVEVIHNKYQILRVSKEGPGRMFLRETKEPGLPRSKWDKDQSGGSDTVRVFFDTQMNEEDMLDGAFQLPTSWVCVGPVERMGIGHSVVSVTFVPLDCDKDISRVMYQFGDTTAESSRAERNYLGLLEAGETINEVETTVEFADGSRGYVKIPVT